MKEFLCTKCNQIKSESEFKFYKSGKKKGSRRAWCSDCERSYQNYRYHNRPFEKNRYDETYRRKVYLKQCLFWEYLSLNPCVKCGETNPLTLHIDHIDPLKNSKVKRIASMVSNGTAWATVLRAIEEQGCQVLCSNCHSIKTHQDNNSWRWKKWILLQNEETDIPIHDLL